MSSIHALTVHSAGLDGKLIAIRRLALRVFRPEASEDEYFNRATIEPQLDLREWKARLAGEGAVILYAAAAAGQAQDANADTPSSEPEVQGFVFNHTRTLDSDGARAYHIWLAAVCPNHRGKGVFPQLLKAAKADALSKDFQLLTLRTMPIRFPNMYAIVTKPNSGWEIVGWTGEGDERKVLMKMKLSPTIAS